MNRKTVKSSMLSEVGYDPETRTLEVEFRNQDRDGMFPVWQYHDVPPDLYSELMAAGSKGGFFAAHVRGRFPESNVTPDWYTVEIITTRKHVAVFQVLAENEDAAVSNVLQERGEREKVEEYDMEETTDIGEVRSMK